MEDYEDNQEVTFPVKKLFILVPNSLYTPGKLSGDNLILARNLESIFLNRAGIAKRSYFNSVYKIKDTNWYVTVEGASPLLTFYQAMAGNDVLRQHREAIVLSFVAKLRQLLLEDPSCRNLCEVVHINGENNVLVRITVVCINEICTSLDHDEYGQEMDYGLFLKDLITTKLSTPPHN